MHVDMYQKIKKYSQEVDKLKKESIRMSGYPCESIL